MICTEAVCSRRDGVCASTVRKNPIHRRRNEEREEEIETTKGEEGGYERERGGEGEQREWEGDAELFGLSAGVTGRKGRLNEKNFPRQRRPVVGSAAVGLRVFF